MDGKSTKVFVSLHPLKKNKKFYGKPNTRTESYLYY